MYSDGHAFGVGGLEDGARLGVAQTSKPKDIKDGASKTILMLESAGHPINYILGRPHEDPPAYFGWYGEWADTIGMFVVPYTADGMIPSFIHPAAGGGITAKGSCIINCNNTQAPYSFHSGGINVSLFDGSVHFLEEDMDANLFWSLCCRDDGNVLGEF